jgi:hypothetical protein
MIDRLAASPRPSGRRRQDRGEAMSEKPDIELAMMWLAEHPGRFAPIIKAEITRLRSERPSPAEPVASDLDERMKPLFAASQIEGVARAICKAQGLCKYVGPRCNTSRCTVTPQTAQAAIQAVAVRQRPAGA